MLRLTRTIPQLTACTLLISLITACGGGAGDDEISDNNDAEIRAVEPFVGVWDLPNDWNGEPNDEAYLVVKSPNSQGEAEAIVYDFDDAVGGAERNCFNIDGFPGTVSQALNTDVFLDVSAFPSATVELLANGNMQISVFSESAGSAEAPTRTLVAVQLGITENEINLCS